MLIRPAQEPDIRAICAAMRDDDAIEQFARRFPGRDNPDALADDIVAAQKTAVHSVVFCNDAGPQTLLSAYLVSPGVARLHRLSTPRWDGMSRGIMRYGMNIFMPLVGSMCHRMECEVLTRHQVAIAILRRLGFAIEGLMRASGRDREDFARLAWVRF